MKLRELVVALFLAACGGESHDAKPATVPIRAATATSAPTAPAAPATWEPPALCRPAAPETKNLSELVLASTPPQPASGGAALRVEDVGTLTLQDSAQITRPSMAVEVSRLPCAWAVAREAASPALRALVTTFLATREDLRQRAAKAAMSADEARALSAALAERLTTGDQGQTPAGHLVRGLLAEERGVDDPKGLMEAVDHYDIAYRLPDASEPLRSYARLNAAMVLFDLTAFEKGLGILDALVSQSLGWADGDALFRIASMYEAAPDAESLEKADAAYRAAARLDPPIANAVAFRLLAINRRLGRFSEVEGIARQLAGVFPDARAEAEAALEEAKDHLANDRRRSSAERLHTLAVHCLPPDRQVRLQVTIDVFANGTAALKTFTRVSGELGPSAVACLQERIARHGPEYFGGAKTSVRGVIER